MIIIFMKINIRVKIFKFLLGNIITKLGNFKDNSLESYYFIKFIISSNLFKYNPISDDIGFLGV